MFIKCTKPKNFDVKSQQDRDWPWSSGPRSFQDRCTQWGPSPVLEPGSTGSATCCAHSWCAPRMTRSCCQTCLSPGLQQSRKAVTIITILLEPVILLLIIQDFLSHLWSTSGTYRRWSRWSSGPPPCLVSHSSGQQTCQWSHRRWGLEQ